MTLKIFDNAAIILLFSKHESPTTNLQIRRVFDLSRVQSLRAVQTSPRSLLLQETKWRALQHGLWSAEIMALIILFAIALLVAGYFHWTAFSN